MSIGIKIQLDAAAIAKLERAVIVTAGMTMEALKTDVIAAQVMPFDGGDMQNVQTFVVQSTDGTEARLVTGSPQARRLYYHPEYNFQTVNNPNAGGEWLEPWVDGDRKDFVQDTFVELYKKEAGL
ncbi:hypothetical protein [Clostridium merdae]|uniref:hypothetical protein n=1 Tax=Clostridium merdae TaxID=1958780 RepID=UPI000A270E28|nr:hypothetical protein [Clostridium merdae]